MFLLFLRANGPGFFFSPENKGLTHQSLTAEITALLTKQD